MEINVQLLREITQCPGGPGYEDPIRALLIREIRNVADEWYIDTIGNLVAIKKGYLENPKRILMDAHMDEISFLVTQIDDKGFVRVMPLGGFDPKALTSLRVTIHGRKDVQAIFGSKSLHALSEKERQQPPTEDSYFLDLGLSSREEVEKYVSLGDLVSRQGEFLELGNCYTSKSMDNRACVYALLEIFKNIRKTPHDFYAVFSCQEEVGLRGAQLAAHGINPHFSICLDTTLNSDTPGIPSTDPSTKLGKGAGIKYVDGYIIADQRMINFLRNTAEREEIKWQAEFIPSKGATNAGVLQRGGKNGSIAGGIALPTRYLHQTIETIHKDDLLNMIKLGIAAVETLDKHHWEY